jgi:hypothetical protein
MMQKNKDVQEDENCPPFLGSWKQIYIMVVVSLVLTIAGIWLFSYYYS